MVSSLFEKIFKLSANKTDIKTEILAGVTTFITMAYIIFVNPNILKMAGMNSSGALGDLALPFTTMNDPVVAAVFTATCLSAAIGTLIMAFYANLPFAQAPGMGLNAFFAFSVCLTLGYHWKQALAAVLVSGLLFIVITITSIREKIVMALPHNLKMAISGGIGLFIALIGLKSGGVIVANPATLISLGSFTEPQTQLTLIGLFITVILLSLRFKGALLLGILLTTIIGIPMGMTHYGEGPLFSFPPSLSPTFFAFDFAGLIEGPKGDLFATFINLLMVVLTFSLVDLFDTIGTLIGTAHKAKMVDKEGRVKNLNKALISDAIATTVGALLGTSTVVTYVESTAGVSVGGRTGLTAFVVALLFILSLFFSGLVGVVPVVATAPVLIVVGALMMGSLAHIQFDDFTEGLPAFLTIAFMPFSYSIANGIAAGIIFYPIVKIAGGRAKEVHPIIYILAGLFILRFIYLPGH